MRPWLGFLLACSVALSLLSGYVLYEIYLLDKSDETLQEELKGLYSEENVAQEPDRDDSQTAEPVPFVVDAGVLALHEENPDCIGWLTIPDTAVDYPVMYRPEDENYYLKRDFNGEYNDNGCLYLSEICDPQESDNLIIYGHHMNSGRMFAALEGYKTEDFCREHPLISFHSLYENSTYRVIAAFTAPVYTGNDFMFYTFSRAENRQDYQEFVHAVKERSLYDTGLSAEYGDKLLTLCTCEYSQKNGRMVVVAKRTEGEGDLSDAKAEIPGAG